MSISRSLSVALATAVVALATSGAQADGDPAKGEKIFKRCMACHTMEAGKHRVGPSLAGVYGRKAGTAEGYKQYSDSLKNADFEWDDEHLKEYLANPRDMFKDAKMMFRVTKEDDRENVIAYLKQASQ